MLEKYEIDNNLLMIIDEELGINIQSDLDLEKKVLYYDNKKIQSFVYYHKNILHGSSTFFSVNGNILAKSWFYLGKRVGKCKQFYNSSKPYSIECFKDGLMEGVQKYFYEDGSIKTILNYKKGLLDGEAKLFYEESLLKRHLIFENGKKIEDHIFDKKEKLIDESIFNI
jgi:antitoxin component YwqK of YwqJK toxin-antitoxin module